MKYVKRSMHTEKGKLFEKLSNTINELKEITINWKVGYVVDLDANMYALNYMERIQANNNFKENETTIILKNRLCDMMTKEEIKKEIKEVTSILSKFTSLTEQQLNELALKGKRTHYVNLINKYAEQCYGNKDIKKVEFYKGYIVKLGKEIEVIENKLQLSKAS